MALFYRLKKSSHAFIIASLMKLHLLPGRWPLFGAGRCGADQSPHLFLRKQLKFDSFFPKWRHEDASRFIRATRYFQFYYRHETRRRLHGVCVCVCACVRCVHCGNWTLATSDPAVWPWPRITETFKCTFWFFEAKLISMKLIDAPRDFDEMCFT